MKSIFPGITLTFGVDTFPISDKSGVVLDVRRLSTVSKGQTWDRWKVHSTHWTWYWQNDRMKWVAYPVSRNGFGLYTFTFLLQ